MRRLFLFEIGLACFYACAAAHATPTAKSQTPAAKSQTPAARSQTTTTKSPPSSSKKTPLPGATTASALQIPTGTSAEQFIFDYSPRTTKRVINFPNDQSLGQIVISPDPYTSDENSLLGAARGTIVVPPGKFVRFVPAHHFFQHPEVINTLPPDSFDALDIAFMSLDDKEDGLCDKALAYIGHFRRVVHLRLDRSDATDKGVAYVKSLKHLQRLAAFQTYFEGESLKELSGLKELRCMFLASSGVKNSNLHYLAAIPNLQLLSLSHSNIDDEGVLGLAGCKEMVCLNIADNPKITDKCLPALLAMKKLKYLNMANTSILTESLYKLKALPLTQLTIPHVIPNQKAFAALRNALPGIGLTIQSNDPRRVDTDTRKLFAPLH